MEITDVKIIPVDDEKLKAFVSIVLDNCFVITDIKVIHGPKGLFISMPSKKRKDGTFKDIAHPLNNQTRQYLEERVLAVYRQQQTAHKPEEKSRPPAVASTASSPAPASQASLASASEASPASASTPSAAPASEASAGAAEAANASSEPEKAE